VLVIVAVRMLRILITPAALKWEHLLFPAGIVALAFATASLKVREPRVPAEMSRRSVAVAQSPT